MILMLWLVQLVKNELKSYIDRVERLNDLTVQHYNFVQVTLSWVQMAIFAAWCTRIFYANMDLILSESTYLNNMIKCSLQALRALCVSFSLVLVGGIWLFLVLSSFMLEDMFTEAGLTNYEYLSLKIRETDPYMRSLARFSATCLILSFSVALIGACYMECRFSSNGAINRRLQYHQCTYWCMKQLGVYVRGDYFDGMRSEYKRRMNMFLDENEISEPLLNDPEADSNCPICLQEFDGQIVRLHCNPRHLYHRHCLQAMVLQGDQGFNSARCALCREPIIF